MRSDSGTQANTSDLTSGDTAIAQMRLIFSLQYRWNAAIPGGWVVNFGATNKEPLVS